jgi:hypothetical protein
VAEDVTLQPAGDETVPVAPAEPAPRPHWFRFYAIYVVLGLALFGAAVAGVVSATRTTTPASAWSTWRPSGAGIGAEQQIAKRIGGEYLLKNGNQLVDVLAKAPSVNASNHHISVGYVAIRGSGGQSDTVVPVSGSNSVMYTLCGLGTSCTIATGKPSVARGLLVRREILELALYTFHYESAINSVIAFMPPSASTKPPVIVFLRRGDLASELRMPLAKSLDPQGGKLQTLPKGETQLVENATGNRVYSFSLTQAQDGNAVLILAPLAA